MQGVGAPGQRWDDLRMWRSWSRQSRAETIFLLVGLAFGLAATVARFLAPDLSFWFILGTFPCSIGLIVIAYRRWDNGRVQRDQLKD